MPNKKIVYLQDLNEKADTLYQVQPNNYLLQKGDIIGISVKVANENPVLQNIFGQTQQMNMNMGATGAGDFYYLTGYTLDDSGFIVLPIIGKIQLEGIDIFAASDTVQVRFNEYLNNVYVQVRFGGLRFSCLGEVNRPGKFLVLQNRMTIFEAVAMAGDLTVLAKRDEIAIMRQYPDGTRIHRVNLLDEHIISSPYYYIQPNDVIYVEPLKTRQLGTGVNALQTTQAIVLVLSTITTTLTLYKLLQ